MKCISFAIIYTEMCGWWDVKGVCARIWRKLPHRWMLSSQQFVLAYWEFSHSKFFSWKICQKIYFSFSFSLHTINYFLPLICISMMEQSWCYMVEYLTFFCDLSDQDILPQTYSLENRINYSGMMFVLLLKVV